MSLTTATPVLLVDGSAYLYRAFHALPPLSTQDGQPTGAIFGVVNMLRKLVAQVQPQYVAVIFDAPGRTFRDDLYQDYKAQRPPMPDELKAQIEPLKQIITAMGLPLLSISGVEADDVIGTLTQQAQRAGHSVLIASGDKDMAQLVNAQVQLYDGMKELRLDVAAVEAKFGVPPARIIDLLALMGDSSDNIPGVAGVGPKTAVKWLNEYGSLDALLKQAEQIKGKVGEKLRASFELVELSRTLATIRCDVADVPSLDQLRPQAEATEQLRQLYQRLEFRAWLSQLAVTTTAESMATPSAPSPAPLEVQYETISTLEQLQTWAERLQHAELIAFDTETTSLDYMQAELVGLSFSVEPGQAAYVPVGHRYLGVPEQLPLAAVLQTLQPILQDPQRAKLGQHIKYDWHILRNYGVDLSGITHDSMLQSYVLDPTGSRHNLDALAQRELGLTTITYEQVAGKGAKQIGFDEVEIERATPYAAEDADVTLRLHQQLWSKLQAQPKLAKLYQELEVPLITVLGRMEHNGVLVDAERLRRQSQDLGKRLLELEEQAYEQAGQRFNLGSPKQLQQILFDKLGLQAIKKTPTGQASTNEDVLEELAREHPLPRVLLEHRGLAKLKSTYTDKLPQIINPRTGRVHTSYHQAVTATGRLSSSEPNLQNIPIRSEAGRRIRQAFIAPRGRVVLAADYSQIELRIMAHLSGDAGLLHAFASGQDIHRATAAEVFATAPDQVSGEQRRAAKAINFGLIYGMSAFGLAQQLGIERGAAQEYVNLYFQRYPGVQAFMEATRQQARQLGYVETVFGRRLYLPEIKDRNANRRAAAERTAINAPLQGTAADIIKRAMLAVDTWIQQSAASSHISMIMQVHDELVFEVDQEYVETARLEINTRMQSAAKLAVQLEVDIGVGQNWDEAH